MRKSTIILLACLVLSGAVVSSCSESDDTVDEYANWQQRNDDFVAQLSQGSLQAIKTYSKDPKAAGKVTDYIYVEKLETGYGTESPLFTDSVRISYRGRLIPTEQRPEGYVFDQTYQGEYSLQTTSVTAAVTSDFVDGFTTALMHMHKGDRWRVYIPYELAYNATEKTGIPAYSTLIFDLALIDFCHPGESFPVWRARQR